MQEPMFHVKQVDNLLQNAYANIVSRETFQKGATIMQFTPAQQQAILARNRELLVSAAAGSGKTAVLVERIVHLIVNDGLSIDKMLIVTFTRAAAGEMRERLETRLASAAGSDRRLRRQSELVASAQISTIHSFCQKIVRRYFQHCDMDPQFGLCDERTRTAFYQESMEETLDWLYDTARDDQELKSLISKYDERQIEQMISQLYQFLMSRPDPMEWLSRHAQKEWSLDTLDQEPMARTFCEESLLIIDGMLAMWGRAQDLSVQPAFPEKYRNTLLSDGETLRELRTACQTGMTTLMETLGSLKFARLPVVKAATSDEAALAETFKDLRSRYKDMVDELKKLLPEDVALAVQDMQLMRPATIGLEKTVEYFHHAFQSKKREMAVIDFNDLEHMTLKLLRIPELQKDMRSMFDAIFVDEYQDVSQLQEAILNALKRPENQYTFYVGDVKQSIYRFRLAEPGLFLGKLSRFSADEDAPERKITLNRNFRSKSAVLDTVNRVFEHVMDQRVTEIDYDDDAHLIPGMPSTGDPETEVHLFNDEHLRPQDQIMAQAEWIAKDIQNRVGTPVLDGNGNPCGVLQYKDIAILLPVSKNIADKVELVLTRAGIPVYCEGANDAMKSDEISQMLQYLTLLDNLMNDVALISVLRSPLFEMTEQELSAIRLLKPEREASFLSALFAYSERSDSEFNNRCKIILEKLEQERFYLRSMPLGDYLWDFLSRSGLYAHYGAQPGGKLRQANLQMLCHRAAEWEKTHMDGLHGFVEALLLDTGSAETSPTVINPWENVVRVMTIHKSKGLEFPTVYVMNLERSLFGRPQASTLSIHGDVGFGLGYVNETMRTKRMTLMQGAIALKNKNAERAERARVLYVALTRPKSRLVMLGADSEKNAGLEALIAQADRGSDVYAVRQAGSMMDWILQSIQPTDTLESFSTGNVRKTAQSTAFSTVSTCFPHKNAPWRVVFHIDPDGKLKKDAKTTMISIPVPVPDEETVVDKTVENRDPLLPDMPVSHLPLKVGVTALCRAIEEGSDIADEEETPEMKRFPFTAAQPKLLSSVPVKPAFLDPPKEDTHLLTGVVTHKVLGLMDLTLIRPVQDKPKALYAVICRYVDDCADRGVLTPQEAQRVNRGMIARFFESELGHRMLRSPRVEREWSFNLRVTEPFPTIVQGVIDLCFLENDQWVLVDFKTDRVDTADELLPRYSRQLAFYRTALMRATPYPVSETLLFSLRLGEAIQV